MLAMTMMPGEATSEYANPTACPGGGHDDRTDSCRTGAVIPCREPLTRRSIFSLLSRARKSCRRAHEIRDPEGMLVLTAHQGYVYQFID